MHKHQLTCLALPLVLGPIYSSHAPAAAPSAFDYPPVAQSANFLADPFESPNLDLPHLALDTDFGFSTPDLSILDTPLLPQVTDPFDTPLSVDLALNDGAPPPGGVQLIEKRSFLSTDFLNTKIPPSIQPAVPLNTEASAFDSYSELARHSQLRRKGPISYSLRLSTAAIYDDNITLASSGKRGDLQLSIGPVARAQIGSDESKLSIGANYSGAASWFVSTPDQRSYDQILGIDSGYHCERLKTNVRLGYQSTHSASRDAGDRTGRQILYGGITSSYSVTAKTSAELSGDVTKATFSGLLGSHEYRVQGFLNYQYTPKLKFGVGATEGILKQDLGTQQTYTQGLLRITAQPTEKLGLSASAGNEWRHYDSDQPSPSTPVFTLGTSWQVTPKTNLSLDGRRRIYSSAALESQNYQSTSVSLGATQMVTSTIDASLILGTEFAHYQSTSPTVQADRDDRYLFSRLGVNWQFNDHCSLGAFYEISHNESTGIQSHQFSRNRIGLTCNLNF